MVELSKNFASSLVATAPSPATSGTSLTVSSGQGTWFPDPAVSNFNVVVCPSDARPTPSNAEIVRVTARSTDTFTITRAQESSSARTIVVGDRIYAGVTAKTLTDLYSYPRMTLTKAAAQTISSGGYGTTVDFDTETEASDPGSIGAFTSVLASDYLRVNIVCVVQVSWWIKWSLTTTGVRQAVLQHQDSSGSLKNSYGFQVTETMTPGDMVHYSHTFLTAVNDRFQVVAFHTQGAPLAFNGGGVENVGLRAVFLSY